MSSLQQACHLLGLPLEIRFEIYRYLTTETFVRAPNYLVLTRRFHKFANLSVNADGSMTVAKAVDLPLRMLASTCRQIESESRQLLDHHEPKLVLQGSLRWMPMTLQESVATEEDDDESVFVKEMLRPCRRGFFRNLDIIYLDAHSDLTGAGCLSKFLKMLGAYSFRLFHIAVLVWNDNEVYPNHVYSLPTYHGCMFRDGTVGKSLASWDTGEVASKFLASDPRVDEYRACETRRLEVVYALQSKDNGTLIVELVKNVVFPITADFRDDACNPLIWSSFGSDGTLNQVRWGIVDVCDFGNSSGFELSKLRHMPHDDRWWCWR